MYNDQNSDTVMTWCTFSGTTAADYGGGIYNGVGGEHNLNGCIFKGNAADSGGGIFYHDSSLSLVNCTLSGNSAEYGGGINDSSTINKIPITVTNCIIWGNTQTYGQELVFSCSPVITYSCWNNLKEQNNNISDNPMLNDDLSMKSGSPCIDRGNSDAVPDSATVDIVMNPRISGSSVEWGYEYQP
jgi:hypothetical protein